MSTSISTRTKGELNRWMRTWREARDRGWRSEALRLRDGIHAALINVPPKGKRRARAWRAACKELLAWEPPKSRFERELVLD